MKICNRLRSFTANTVEESLTGKAAGNCPAKWIEIFHQKKPADGKGAGFHPAPRENFGSAQGGILVSIRDSSVDKALSWDVAHQGVNSRFAKGLELGSSTSLGIALTTRLFAILVPALLFMQHFCSKRRKEKSLELLAKKSFFQRDEKLFASPY